MRRQLLPFGRLAIWPSFLVLLGMTLLGSRLSAQQPVPTQPVPTGSPAVVKYGKWGLLAASVAMNLLARNAHQQADDEFAFITEACVLDRASCATLPDGRYADPTLEQHYQRSLDHDSRARTWLVGGETALVASAVGFIWELTRAKARQKNIPFEPEVSERDGRTQLGLRFAF